MPHRYADKPHLIEGWPDEPFVETCSDISINALRWELGSAIKIVCQTEIDLMWSQLVDLRDLGFLVP